MSKTPPADLERRLFTPYHKLLVTLRGQLRSLPLAPVNVLACLVSQTMDIPRAHLDSPSTARLQNLKQKPLELPSDGKYD